MCYFMKRGRRRRKENFSNFTWAKARQSIFVVFAAKKTFINLKRHHQHHRHHMAMEIFNIKLCTNSCYTPVLITKNCLFLLSRRTFFSSLSQTPSALSLFHNQLQTISVITIHKSCIWDVCFREIQLLESSKLFFCWFLMTIMTMMMMMMIMMIVELVIYLKQLKGVCMENDGNMNRWCDFNFFISSPLWWWWWWMDNFVWSS